MPVAAGPAFCQMPSVDDLLRSVEEEGAQKAPTPVYSDSQLRYAEIVAGHQRTQMQFKVVESLIFLLAAIICQITALRYMQKRGNYSIRHIVSITGLLAIVFGTLVVIMIADTDEQMTAAVGILGAVAGYIFGKSRMEDEVKDDMRRRAAPLEGEAEG